MEFLVEQRHDRLDEMPCVVESTVELERTFISPSGMNVELAGVPHRQEGMDTKVSGLRPSWRDDLSDERLYRSLLPEAGMKAHEDEERIGRGFQN